MSNSKFTENPAKFLSIFVDRMVPDYVREDHPMFITFMQEYFKYLERETSVNGELGEYKQITDLVQNVDVDHALDIFVPEFEKQYLLNIPSNAIDATVPTTDKAFLAKNIKEAYKEKGTVNALDFLFRREFNTSAQISYPKDFMLKASGSIWYEPKWINVDGTRHDINYCSDTTILNKEDCNEAGETWTIISGESEIVAANRVYVTDTSIDYPIYYDLPDQDIFQHEQLVLTIDGQEIPYTEGARSIIWDPVGGGQSVPNYHTTKFDKTNTTDIIEYFLDVIGWTPLSLWSGFQFNGFVQSNKDGFDIGYKANTYLYEDVEPAIDWAMERIPDFVRVDTNEDGDTLPDDWVDLQTAAKDYLEGSNNASAEATEVLADFVALILTNPEMMAQPYDWFDWDVVSITDFAGVITNKLVHKNAQDLSKAWTVFDFDVSNDNGVTWITSGYPFDSSQYNEVMQSLNDDAVADPNNPDGRFDICYDQVVEGGDASICFMLRMSSQTEYESGPDSVSLNLFKTFEVFDVTKLYNKRIIGQTSGATAFVDIEEDMTMAERSKLLITEVDGSFLHDEEVWEDVGSSGDIPTKVTVISDGIVAPATCYINGVAWSTENGPYIPQTKSACEGLVESDEDVNTAVWLPNGYWVDSTGFLSSDRKMQDNNYFQDFSYVIRSSVPIQAYREVLKKLVHPVGLKLFAEYVFESTVPMGTTLPEDYAAYLISIFTYLDVAVDIYPIGKCSEWQYDNEITCLANGALWTRGKSFKTAHTRHYTWTRPETFELQEDIIIPWAHVRWDGTTREHVDDNGNPQGDGQDEIIFAGTCDDDSTIHDQTACLEIPDYTWTPTTINPSIEKGEERFRVTNWQCTVNAIDHTYLNEAQQALAGAGCFADGGDWVERTLGENYGTQSDEWIFVNRQWKTESLYSKSEDFIGDEHSGFEEFLESGYDDYVLEILKNLEATSRNVAPEDWKHPSDHLCIDVVTEPHVIGTTLHSKLYQIFTMNESIRLGLNAFPEELQLDFYTQLKVLDIDEQPSLESVLNIRRTFKGIKEYDGAGNWLGTYNEAYKATDGRMIGCEVWELLVAKGLESILEHKLTTVQVESYAPEQNYRFWEQNRENNIIQSIYGSTNDIIDSVHIEAFEVDSGIRTHTHGEVDGFAPMVDTVLTKGLELPEIAIGVSAFHTHTFDGGALKNLIVHGKEVDASGINYDEARRLIDRDYFEVPEMMGANLVCGGIMTPPLWGDWVDSQQDPRYNGYGECFNSAYDNPTDCITAFGGNPMFWMPPMCSNMSNMSQTVCEGMSDTWVANPPSACSDGTSPDHIQCGAAGETWTWETPSYCMSSEASCNAVGHSWGYFTLVDLPPMKGHKSHFVEGQVVDRQRGRMADPLTRKQARFLIDNPTETVTLYDNVGYLDDGLKVQTDGFGVTDGGTITNILGHITSGHYHEYEVSYDADWKNLTDWQNNALTHGFIYTPITTWLCFNYRPDLPVDETAMGGMDFLGNQWPQNVFMEIPDSYIAGFLMNPDITLQHNQTWSEELNPNVDWVELYSSNFIQEVPGSGNIDDLIGVEFKGTGTDIATIEAYPRLNGEWITIIDMSGYIYLRNTTTLVDTLLLDLSSLQHDIGLGSFMNYDERGVLGLAYHPDYNTNGKFYVYYMTEQGGGVGAWGFPLSSSVISEFTADLTGNFDSADISSERILMIVPQPDFNHNGGELAFGPDGFLYIGLGDGGSAGDVSWSDGHGGHGEYGNAQNPTNLLGNILRIDVASDGATGMPYTIPADNPFVNSIYKEGQAEAEPFRPEIWAMGFRNPWRFSFAPDGKLWAADVGQDKFEEINIIEKGGNYGWRVIEGYHEYEEDQSIIDQMAIDLGYESTLAYLSDLKKPIHEYSHGVGISICGGFVYRGTLLPELQGKFIFGDWGTNWDGTTGRLYTLEENTTGLAANFNVLPNAVNGATHSHTVSLTAAEVQLLQDNPGTPVTALQTDTTHAEFYVHLFTIIYSSVDGLFHIIGQTNPEGHDVLEFVDWSDDIGYTRKSLSFWDPATEVVTLETFGESLLTIGEDTDGEIYFTTRYGIQTFQPPFGEGPNNTDIYKITNVYNSVDIPNAPEQIPSSETAHTHGYEVTYNHALGIFESHEISDIEMENWDAFWPEWTTNDPASHVHPVITGWTGITDEQIPLGSSAGWYYNADTGVWGPYDIGADTAWAPPAADEVGYITIDVAPHLSVLIANEYDTEGHIHYFDDLLLDSFGANYGRRSNSLSQVAAEILANQEEGSIHILYSSIIDDGTRRHYHEYNITYSVAQRQFIMEEVGEWEEGVRDTGQYVLVGLQTHEHPTSVDGVITSVGWNGDPSFEPPEAQILPANDWDNLNGSLVPHEHYFNGTTLDQIGPNSNRFAVYLSNQQTTDLISGSLQNVTLYSSIFNDHYHEYFVTFDSLTGSLIIQENEQWVSSDNQQYFIRTPADHRHPVSVDGVPSGTGYNQIISVDDLPFFNTPGFPYPGGSHPHEFDGTVVGPFADGAIAYSVGFTPDQAYKLIDGIYSQVTLYDSIEGAHFHKYVVKWNDTDDIFYASSSLTYIRGGIEDALQDPNRYYVSVVLNPSEGLHWHNLTIEWNPNNEITPQQTGGSVYQTNIASTYETLVNAPTVEITVNTTELNPVTTQYADTPDVGDTTSIITYSDLTTTTTVTTTVTEVTETIQTNFSDGTSTSTSVPPVITTDVDTDVDTLTIENTLKRKTFVNDVLQANNPPVLYIGSTFIDGEGSHDHLLYDGCSLDTQGPFSGRICEPISLSTTNQLINAQDSTYGIVWYDSPNGADSHYHSYSLKYNPLLGADGSFVPEPISQYDRFPGSGTNVHQFTLSGGFHTHAYFLTEAEYATLLGGGLISVEQGDAIHADLYTHTLVIRFVNSQYSIVSQTSDFDNHDTLVYVGVTAEGGQWIQSTDGSGLGDHIHGVTVDDSVTWPIPA